MDRTIKPVCRTEYEAKYKRSDLIVFGILTSILILLVHAVAYMTHEYAHSFTAWSLGWMANPLALDYGHATVSNILLLGDVSDNVSYEPIFASGHGLQATVIALAGVTIGNGALYFALYGLTNSAWISRNRIALSVIFWLSLMCAGNVWSYVPIRAVATHADIALAARGLGVSPLLQLPLILPAAIFLVWHFFTKMCARCFPGLSAGSTARTVFLIALTSYWFFVFFVGDAAGGSYGIACQIMAIISKYFLFPLSTMWLWREHQRLTVT